MFQSISYDLTIRTRGTVVQTANYTHHITDTDFGTENWTNDAAYAKGYTLAIIECYKSKQLDVPLNLYLYHRWREGNNMCLYENINFEIGWCMKYVPEYKEYAEEVERYNQRYSDLKSFW